MSDDNNEERRRPILPIATLRAMTGIGQTELARRLGVNQKTVSSYESTPNVKLQTLVNYLLVLEADTRLTVSVDGGSVVYRLSDETGLFEIEQEMWD